MTVPHFVRPPHHELPRGHRHDGAGHDGMSLNRSPRPSTAPAGLFAPAPEVVREKVAKPPKPRPSKAKNPADYKPRPIAACGTVSGYSRHRRRGEEVCVPCRDANRVHKREYNRKWAAARPPRVRKQVERAACGTETGYSAHRTRRDRICDACREAHNGKQRERRRIRAGNESSPERQTIAAHGTASGYKRHRRNGEQACDECLAAKRKDDAEYRAGRRAA